SVIARLNDAITRDDASQVAAIIAHQEFTLIETPEDSEEGSRAAMTGEVDDFPVLLAFTSGQHASKFADTMPEINQDDGGVPGFIVDGNNLVTNAPDGFGLLLNMESDDVIVVLPGLVDRVRRVLTTA